MVLQLRRLLLSRANAPVCMVTCTAFSLVLATLTTWQTHGLREQPQAQGLLGLAGVVDALQLKVKANVAEAVNEVLADLDTQGQDSEQKILAELDQDVLDIICGTV